MPSDKEASCLLPMLDKEENRFKILLAMAGSPGWFNLIKDLKLSNLMTTGPEFAGFIIPALSRAFRFNKEDVFDLVKSHWLPESAYDESVLNLFTYLDDWDQTAIEIVCIVAKRRESIWISHIGDLVSQSRPQLAPKIVRADFDRRLDEAITKDAEITPPEPPPSDASETEKEIYELRLRKGEEFKKLLSEDKGWYELSQIAEAAPDAFLDAIWPWFLSVVERIAYEPHPFGTGYQEDHSLGTLVQRDNSSPDQPVSALYDAITILSEKDPEKFLDFYRKNLDCPFMAIHRLLCAGLDKIVQSHASVVLDYLISDTRRLVIGDSFDCHKESRRLISRIVPHLKDSDRELLEKTVIQWNRYYKTLPEWTPKERFEKKKWNREHRLRLLRAFPEKFLSETTRRLREEEERALPGVLDWDSKIGGARWVGSPMSHEQMVKAKDEHILTLFEELEDKTEWTHPKRSFGSGGSVQASRVLAQLAEKEPERVANIILSFEPGRQERPAAMSIAGLSRSSLTSERLFKLVQKLVEKGHSSHEFRTHFATKWS